MFGLDSLHSVTIIDPEYDDFFGKIDLRSLGMYERNSSDCSCGRCIDIPVTVPF